MFYVMKDFNLLNELETGLMLFDHFPNPCKGKPFPVGSKVITYYKPEKKTKI